MDVDPRFRQARAKARTRRRRGLVRRLLSWGLGAGLVISAATWLTLSGWVTIRHPAGSVTGSDACAAPDPTQHTSTGYAAAFIDLPGNPMVLHFDTGTSTATRRTLLRPAEIPDTRVGADLTLLQDVLIPSEDRLIAVLPSKREDFAFFQAQRQAGLQTQRTVNANAATPPKGQETTVTVSASAKASWGDALAPDKCGGASGTLSYAVPLVGNTTSYARVVPDGQRVALYEDVVLRLKEKRSLTALLIANGFDPTPAAVFAAQAETLLPALKTLGPGNILALRRAKAAQLGMPVQLTLRSCDAALGSLASTAQGTLVSATDPWPQGFSCDDAAPTASPAATAEGQYRMLDAFYSAALRNRVPSGIVGEAIVLLSQSFDMDAFAAPDDRVSLLYSADAGTDGPGAGQILYVGISGPGKSFECFVARVNNTEPFTCHAPGLSESIASGSPALRNGLTVPVVGILTAGFGPQLDAKLGVVRLSKGVDWAAPVGTPVAAAVDGTILSASDEGSYGNVVRIRHAGGQETRYANLDHFAEAATTGAAIRAGDVIGYVGTSGISTGPHLHFELYLNGAAVDPLDSGGAPLAGDEAVEEATVAVETMTDRIIQIESGGKLDAANPNSTALGPGQFLKGTWRRMMQTYRPELVASMTDDALLALRTDPTLAREMVRNLAREGEAYLRANKHQVTAGGLYLCHFAGMEAANKLLSVDPSTPAVDVLGQEVQDANEGIIKGRTAADVVQWAERRMSGKAAPAAVPPMPPEILAYRAVIEGLIGQPL